MRGRFVVGNWKMHANLADSVVAATKLRNGMHLVPSDVTVVVCPPTPWLYPVAEVFEHSSENLQLGAQNLWPGKDGRYTGETSAWMLGQMCQFVIIGHSERRQFFGETNQTVNKKIKAALASGLLPIVCVGEVLEERETGKTFDVVKTQVTQSLAGFTPDELSKFIIAYEPVWAISQSGVGIPCTPDDADDVQGWIKNEVKQYLGKTVPVLYGGSVNSENVLSYLSREMVDGVLVGSASTKFDSFLALIRAAESL